MRAQIRIVAGKLKGRKVACDVHPELRPTPQMVREAFFSILGNAIPGRPFFDLFAGTGVVGMEALSRGASHATLVERDIGQANSIQAGLREFELTKQGKVYRTDVYRWIEAWKPPAEPVNVFLSPPFPDLTKRAEFLVGALESIRSKVADESVVVLQAERGSPLEDLGGEWELRRYGRNSLLIWQRGGVTTEAADETSEEAEDVEPSESDEDHDRS